MKEYRQSRTAITISYVAYRWFLAAMTIGILALFDYMRYKNTKLSFESKFLVFVTGAFSTQSKEVPYEDIQSVRVEKSFLGNIFNYGTIIVLMKDGSDTIVFKYVENPEEVRKVVQDHYVRSEKVKVS